MRTFVTILVMLMATVFIQAETINVPADQPTIQAGIDAAVNGDTVLVADGLYLENINFLGKAITVSSHYLVDGDTAHISGTVIDGSQPSTPDSGSVVYFVSGEDTTSVLYGLTITGGSGTNYTEPGYVGVIGGGVYIDGASARLRYNSIRDNRIDVSSGNGLGGGISVDGNGAVGSPYLVILENNHIHSNSVEAQEFAEAGGFFTYSKLRMIGNIIENNHVVAGTRWANGGGGVIWADAGEPQLSPAILYDNVIRNNSAVSTVQNCISGGILFFRVQAVMERNVVSGNTGAGVTVYGAGLAIWDPPLSTFGRIEDNRITENRVVQGNGRGAGIYIQEGRANLARNIIMANESGAGLHSSGLASNLTMENNLVANGNGVSSGGLNLVQGRYKLFNNTIVNNHASSSGQSGAILVQGAADIHIVNGIVWGNTPPESPQINVFNGTAEVHYSDVEGGWAGTGEGNIDLDPLFIAGDSLYHLSINSPGVNSGTDSLLIDGQWYNCPADDYEGDERPHLGTMADMGADETQVPVGVEPLPLTGIPASFTLEQNYPNPFNPATTIEFSLPRSGLVTLTIYNILGAEVAELVAEELAAGNYKYEWDAGNLASGVYFYRLETGKYSQTRKLLLLR